MDWAVPAYSKNQINQAGILLASGCTDVRQAEEAHKILNNWRSAHAYALNHFQLNMRKKVKDLTEGRVPLVAQRLKRTPSIIKKLKLQKTMKLSTMQDIAGCRAVVRHKSDVIRLRWDYVQSSH